MNNDFFYIDSYNVADVKNKCYGFCISEFDNELCLSSASDDFVGGTFINVKKIESDIYIEVDDFSSFYIFYYVSNDFFAVSNSFYILLENLKKLNKPLTIDKTAIEQYIQSPLHIHSLSNTLIKEINILPFSKNIKISNNKIEFIEKNIKFQYINVLSEEGINIINEWITKWSEIIKAIYSTSFPIQVDLSGGFDSRTIFSLIYGSNINLNDKNITVYSKIGKTKGMIYHLGDDYNIASEICKTLNINLNANINENNTEANYNSSNEQYEILKNCFMAFHKEGYLCIKKYKKPKFHFGGLNGEIIRGALPSENAIKYRFNKNPIKNNPIVLEEFYKDIDLLESNSKSKHEALTKYFLSNQCRAHYGMSIYNDYLANIYLISPFNDKNLLKLYVPENVDKNIIFAIIIYKTCPKIFDIKFSDNRTFNEKTKQLAIEYSNKFPLNKKYKTYTIKNVSSLYKEKQNNKDNKSGDDILFKKFTEGKDIFIKKMSEFYDYEYANKLYEYSKNYYMNKENFFPNTWINTITSIIEVFNILD